ncbi:hypothetical protein ACA910_012513 [Epithemia clementina (nom. ined.)]
MSSSSTSSFREASRVLFQELWEDLSLFNFSFTSEDSLSELSNNKSMRDPEADVVHFCFLVHGHRGFSKDLSYLQAVMRNKAIDRKEKEASQREDATISNEHRDKAAHNKIQDLVVHATNSNERKTDDGVEAGGSRLMEEVRSVILEEMRRRESASNKTLNAATDELPVITVSFLGNSLGGLYSRYAIAKLFENCERDPSGHFLILDGRYRLYLNIFCTTATPHLGVASHTFIRIPRTAELGVARAMGQTGRDLFRVNNLMRQMATLRQFIDPMKLFRHRIAYANAYGTDFPVPVHTAAFLHDESDYPHHFVANKFKEKIAEEHSDLCVATMYTPPRHHQFADNEQPYLQLSEQNGTADNDEEENELVVMSRSLDSLGWKKVFVDPRKIVPKLSNPIPRLSKVASLRLNLTNSTGSGSDAESITISDSEHDDDPSEGNFGSERSQQQEQQERPPATTIELLKARGVAPSREVFHAVSAAPSQANDPFHWPFGHNMIVAMSRNSIYTYLNKSGRPIVDALAAELVDDIFSFSEEDADNQEALLQ